MHLIYKTCVKYSDLIMRFCCQKTGDEHAETFSFSKEVKNVDLKASGPV